MGQQQIFLIVLVTIIVGIATIIAIDTMEETHIEANKTAVRQDILIILNDAQKYYYTPATMGGGGKSFNDISEGQIVTIEPSNNNGDYDISGDDQTVIVNGQGNWESVTISATANMGSNNKLSIQWADSPK